MKIVNRKIINKRIEPLLFFFQFCIARRIIKTDNKGIKILLAFSIMLVICKTVRIIIVIDTRISVVLINFIKGVVFL